MKNLKNIVINREKVKQADLIVGIPSLNEADNISFVVKQVDKGLTKYFSAKDGFASGEKKVRAVIVNLDNNSLDGTREEFLKTKTKNPKIYMSTPKNIRGKGYNFYNLFNLVASLKAQAVAVVDADLESITPEWMDLLFKPILKKNDYATPYYARSEYDGTITNQICYPLIYGLFGYNLRQPIGGDFSFSGRLAEYWLKQKWHKTTYKYGIDIFMTMNAVLGNFKIAQVGLGAKIHKPSAPKLGPMFSQVVTTLFKNIEANQDKWLNLKEVRSVPYFGKKKLALPQTVSVDYKGMKTSAIFNFKTNEDILDRILSPSAFYKVKKMYYKEKLDIIDTLWSRIVYDAIYSYHTMDLNGGLIEALKPLYFGRFVSFYKQTLEKPFEYCEERIINQAKLFWKNRNYLIKKIKNNKK